MSRRARGQLVKRIIAYWDLLFQHGMRDFIMPYDHIYKRQLIPLCRMITDLTEIGTSGDFKEIVEGFRDICTKRTQTY